ncbi:MAG TPA: universal stress protein [Hyphomicrobiaceae bacterium]|nr:universal stress protein [Hyphomicrobiaceae bacterium]
MPKKRRSFEQGHRRKYLVIVDESQEVESALYFAASRIGHSVGGGIKLLYVIEPHADYTHWVGVRQVQIEEEQAKAKALFRLFRMKLTTGGFDNVVVEEDVREGKKVETILKVIDEDEDIGILVLGAAVDNRGPGPLVASLATGKFAGTFPIPVVIVPGELKLEDITSMA